MKLEISVCDVCQDLGREVTSWVVQGPEGKTKVELCDEHSAPLKALYGSVTDKQKPARATTKPAAKKAAGGRTRGPRRKAVVDINDVKAARFQEPL